MSLPFRQPRWQHLVLLIWLLSVIAVYGADRGEEATKQGRDARKKKAKISGSGVLQKGETPKQAMERLEAESRNGIINMDLKLFTELLMHPEKDFSTVVIATGSGEYCPFCEDVNKMYSGIVADVKTQLKGNRLEDSEGNPVFFAFLWAMKEETLSRIIMLDSIPKGFMITPNNLECRADDNGPMSTMEKLREDKIASVKGCQLTDRTSSKSLDVKEGWITLSKFTRSIPGFRVELLKWISGAEIADQINKAIGEEQARQRLLKIGSVVLIIGSLGLYFFDFLRGLIIRHRSIVASLALLSFFISTSGLIYSIQNGLVPYGHGKDGSVQWISKQPRSQYTIEGFCFAISVVLFSLLLHMAMNVHPFIANPLKTKITPGWKKTLAGVICGLLVAGVYVLFVVLRNGVRAKHPFLQPTFWPDKAHFTYGSHRRDRMYAF